MSAAASGLEENTPPVLAGIMVARGSETACTVSRSLELAICLKRISQPRHWVKQRAAFDYHPHAPPFRCKHLTSNPITILSHQGVLFAFLSRPHQGRAVERKNGKMLSAPARGAAHDLLPPHAPTLLCNSIALSLSHSLARSLALTFDA